MAALLLGCGTTHQEVGHPEIDARDPYFAALTSGSVGCPPDEIRISSFQSVVRFYVGRYAGEATSWTASCRGKQFYCSGPGTTRCSEALSPAAP